MLSFISVDGIAFKLTPDRAKSLREWDVLKERLVVRSCSIWSTKCWNSAWHTKHWWTILIKLHNGKEGSKWVEIISKRWQEATDSSLCWLSISASGGFYHHSSMKWHVTQTANSGQMSIPCLSTLITSFCHFVNEKKKMLRLSSEQASSLLIRSTNLFFLTSLTLPTSGLL